MIDLTRAWGFTPTFFISYSTLPQSKPATNTVRTTISGMASPFPFQRPLLPICDVKKKKLQNPTTVDTIVKITQIQTFEGSPRYLLSLKKGASTPHTSLPAPSTAKFIPVFERGWTLLEKLPGF